MWVQIQVKEHLGHCWQEWFEESQIIHKKGGTSLLSGELKDQCAFLKESFYAKQSR